jgi:hypothetical protein
MMASRAKARRSGGGSKKAGQRVGSHTAPWRDGGRTNGSFIGRSRLVGWQLRRFLHRSAGPDATGEMVQFFLERSLPLGKHHK